MNGYEFSLWVLGIFFAYGAVTTIANAWRDKPQHKNSQCECQGAMSQVAEGKRL